MINPSGQNIITRTPIGTVTGPGYQFQGGPVISIEPEVYLNQKARYLQHLHELRRINEGDDTADSPGYALNLIRFPISILPGKCTEAGHGAEMTMTLTPHLNPDLLPTTFRNLVLNDLVEQIAYPVTQFINNPENSIYLDDRRPASSGDLTGQVAQLFELVDTYPEGIADNLSQLETLRYVLSLQPLFKRSEWTWVDDLLREKAKMGNKVADRETFAKTYMKYNNLIKGSLPIAIVPATKSRRASLPFPPAQMVDVYGFNYTYQIAVEAHRGLWKERFSKPCVESDRYYFHMPDVQGFLHEEIAGVQKLLADPHNGDLWRRFSLEYLATAVRSNQTTVIRCLRTAFANAVKEKAGPNVREITVALAWAYVVESALLTEQLVQDMKESAAAKGCPCPPNGWLDYFMPEPSAEARAAFNQYVKCRWPIHVFSLDPVAQQQNLSDTYSARRELQLAMSLAFVTGQLSASNMTSYARRIEVDMATVDLNNTAVGFSHGDNTFGWRFYPRFQTPDIESNATVFFRDMLIGGPKKNALLRQRRLEPGIRECVAVVMMPSFVPYADLSVNSNWFALTNPKRKLMDAECAMRMSKAVKMIETCGPQVADAACYRDGDLCRLMDKAKQLGDRLPYQSASVQIPYENTLGGFAMFNTGVTDLAPELTGWYGSPSINPCQYTTLFLVGNHFSVHQTKVIAGGQEVWSGLNTSTGNNGTSEMLSREVIKVVIPPNPQLVGNAQQKFVDVHLATPYGVSQHLLIPVCGAASQSCPAAVATPPTPPPAPAAIPAPMSPPTTVVVPQGTNVTAPAGTPVITTPSPAVPPSTPTPPAGTPMSSIGSPLPSIPTAPPAMIPALVSVQPSSGTVNDMLPPIPIPGSGQH
jgi:hypothetical protein